MSKVIAIIFGVLLMVLGVYELKGGLAGESCVQACRYASIFGVPDAPVAIMEPWQRIGTGGGVSLFGLIVIIRQLGIFRNRKDK